MTHAELIQENAKLKEALSEIERLSDLNFPIMTSMLAIRVVAKRALNRPNGFCIGAILKEAGILK